jgi:hypothetical protein
MERDLIIERIKAGLAAVRARVESEDDQKKAQKNWQ